MNSPPPIYIVSAVRTPIGAFSSSLAKLTAVDLGAKVIQAAIARVPTLQPHNVDEVFFGNALSAGIGQNPARQCALKGGLPEATPCTTVNKSCESGLKAIIHGYETIKSGRANVVVVGVTESMSNVPYYFPRKGVSLGNQQLVDGILRDGLNDTCSIRVHIGIHAEKCAAEHNICREQQNLYTITSYKRAQKAQLAQLFKDEIVPLEVSGGRDQPNKIVDVDEEISRFDEDKLQNLTPAFIPNISTITAASASPISDGASALVLMSGTFMIERDMRPIARIVDWAEIALAPEDFALAPAQAISLALKRAKIDPAQVDCYEIGEPFSVVTLITTKLLSLDPRNVNKHGGAFSLGQPLGAFGARITTTLIGCMKASGGIFGVSAICSGGGGASAEA